MCLLPARRCSSTTGVSSTVASPTPANAGSAAATSIARTWRADSVNCSEECEAGPRYVTPAVSRRPSSAERLRFAEALVFQLWRVDVDGHDLLEAEVDHLVAVVGVHLDDIAAVQPTNRDGAVGVEIALAQSAIDDVHRRDRPFMIVHLEARAGGPGDDPRLVRIGLEREGPAACGAPQNEDLSPRLPEACGDLGEERHRSR